MDAVGAERSQTARKRMPEQFPQLRIGAASQRPRRRSRLDIDLLGFSQWCSEAVAMEAGTRASRTSG